MDVTVSARDHILKVVLHGEIDESAPMIVDAAVAVARAENLALVVDTSYARPRSSPLVAAVQQIVAAQPRDGESTATA